MKKFSPRADLYDTSKYSGPLGRNLQCISAKESIDRRGQFFLGILAPKRIITPTRLKLGPGKVFLTHPNQYL